MLAHNVQNLIEHPPYIASLRCGVSPDPLIPPESRTFRSNQLHMMSYLKEKLLKQQSIRKQQKNKHHLRCAKVMFNMQNLIDGCRIV
ncbi:hypothetical protein [Falsibacillus albus]|uniref:hypothetical protein n=1 Tax=Falsibacillus albus TaxID=2478915 RepID=UPI0011E59777|nr:hypothetical protein [Falsibacillus albus]